MDLTEEIVSKEEDLTLTSPNNPFSLSLRVENFYSEKDYDKFVKNVERLVRYSCEYRQWVAYIIEILGVRQCAMTEELLSECDIEIHHHPINLYTVCNAVISSYINKGKKFCSYDIATDVIELHFRNKIGYVPLLSDIHKKFHGGFQDIPIEFVSGDYKYIIDTYSIPDDDLQRICSLCNTHVDDCKLGWSKGKYPGLKD